MKAISIEHQPDSTNFELLAVFTRSKRARLASAFNWPVLALLMSPSWQCDIVVRWAFRIQTISFATAHLAKKLAALLCLKDMKYDRHQYFLLA